MTNEDRAPVFVDALTGWQWNTARNVSPVFRTGWQSLGGEMQPPEPGRVFARPTSRHQTGYGFVIRVYVIDPDKGRHSTLTDDDGNVWEIDVSASRWDSDRLVDLPWETRGKIREELAAMLRAWLRSTDAAARRLTIAVDDARSELEWRERELAKAREALAAAEVDRDAAARRLAAAEVAAEVTP